MIRKINAPGIEINEIDRSGYTQTENLNGTISLVTGFADKGDDYRVRWINSMSTFKDVYGEPTNDAEMYFYNAANEVLTSGGILTTAKLPYSNNAFEHYSYTSYNVLSNYTAIESPVSIISNDISSSVIDKSLYDFLFLPNIDIETINRLIYEDYGTEISNMFIQYDLQDYITSESEEQAQRYTRNITDTLNDCGIFLKSINDLFNSVRDRMKFTYEQRQCFDILFYKDNHIRNESVYLLSAIWKDDEQSKEYIQKVLTEIEYIETKRYFSELKNTISMNLLDKKITDFREIIRQFVESNNMHQIKYYYTNTADLIHSLNQLENSKAQFLNIIIDSFSNIWKLDTKYTELKGADSSITSFVEIQSMPQKKGCCGLLSFNDYDNFKTGINKPPKNQIMIVDITRSKYQKDKRNNEYIGLLPVITTATNAMYYQGVIEDNDNITDYTPLKYIQNTYTIQLSSYRSGTLYVDPKLYDKLSGTTESDDIIGFNELFGGEDGVTIDTTTVSRDAISYFPKIRSVDGKVERKYLKQIGIVVFKMYTDYSNDNKVSFLPVESFVGSLNRTDRDDITKNDIFIDNVVNNNSRYINVFSNVNLTHGRDIDKTEIDLASTYKISNQTATSLGFYEKDTDKRIHVKNSIIDALSKIFSHVPDYTKLDIDIVADAGVSNIAQFIASTQLKDEYGVFVENKSNRSGYFDLNSDDIRSYTIDTEEDVSIWRFILQRFDDFVKNTRKDCMFIADSPRPFCLEGNQKMVRMTKPGVTIRNSILPKVKYLSGALNSSYSTGYLNWFKCKNAYNNDYMWVPPSIKVMGIYTKVDTRSNFWDAPAGLNRGIIEDAIDVAFSPNVDESGTLYTNSWNYAVNYPIGGIVLEGQRTFQTEKTALDRVNVRRLLLGLEKIARNYVKYYNYEGNTSWNRQRLVDGLSKIFETIKNSGGMLDYAIICDDRNNTIQTIDNNELHIQIYVKPVKAIEFIIMNFICTSQSANVEEMIFNDFGR